MDKKEELKRLMREYGATDEDFINRFSERMLHFRNTMPEMEEENKRKFEISTPCGTLKVWAKHSQDCPQDYPGVYVDFIEKNGDAVMLACVEYDSFQERLQTCVYGDADSDSPTDVVIHRHLNETE